MPITTRDLSSLIKKKGKWMTESLEHGHGSIAFRCLANGIGVYYRYHDTGKLVNLPIGRYDESGKAGISLKQARSKASELSALHAAGIKAIREHIAVEEKKANEALRKATSKATAGTFAQLLEAYTNGLIHEGKLSAPKVRNMLRKWVFDAHVEIITRRANEITHDDIMRILIMPTEAGLTRTVNQLRSHLLAAFNKAISAVGDPSLAASIGTGYDLTSNPVAMTKVVKKFERARRRILSDEELRFFINEVERLPFITQAALKICLYLGGQRPQQIVRINADDVDLSSGIIRLFDGKGRRSQPRVHMLPLPPSLVGLFKQLIKINADAPSLFCNDGKTIMDTDTLSHRVRVISGGRYQMRDIRRTVETRLARLGISKHIRAQLQSHGLSGVQERHYDHHDYMDEKLIALKAWENALSVLLANSGEAKVVLMRKVR
jgi:integrase